MKLAVIILSLGFVTNALALEDLKLSFTDETKVEKIVMNEEILLKNLIDLHSGLDFDGERMIAGQFETKKTKKSYLENLRSKLDDCKGYSRF